MLIAISAALRWFYSVGTKFLRVVPGYTFLIVVATIISQLALLLAFFLPLKVIILLGSANIPHYFPNFLLGLERDPLILGLSATAASFYILYLLVEKLISLCTKRGANKLLTKSHKISLFENQEDVAAKGYQRYARCLAGGFFIGLVLLLLLFIYPSILGLIAGYLAAVVITLGALYRWNRRIRTRLLRDIGGLMTSLAAIGFLLCFGFIVVQFLFGAPVSLLVAVIVLLLSRQTFNRIAAFVNDFSVLYSQRLKLNALFFHGQILLKDNSNQMASFWSLISLDVREVLVRNILQNLLGVKPDRITLLWNQTGVPDVVSFVVTAYAEDTNTANFLVKIFNHNRNAMATHEATLLTDIIDDGIPSLELLSVGEVDSLRCHIFVMPKARKLSIRQVKPKSWLVMAALANVSLTQELVARYGRSKPYLWQRFDAHISERLRLAAVDDQSLGLILNFELQFSTIQSLLQVLPLAIVNPDLNIDTIFLKEDDSLVVSHWGRWSLEPIGAGWPTQEKQLKVLAEAVFSEREKKELDHVIYEHLKLAALMFAFERAYLKQQYLTAIEMLPDILACLDSSEKLDHLNN